MLMSIISATLEYGVYLLAAGLACSVIEFFVSGEKQSVQSKVRGFLFWIFYFWTGIFCAVGSYYVIASWGLKPLFSLDLTKTINSENIFVMILGYTLVPLIPALMYDIGYYIYHRIEHNFDFFWRVHSVHHSIEELNSINNYHHFLEDIFKIPFVVFPTMLLFSISVPHVVIIAVFIRIWGIFLHTNAPISLGIFRFVITDPSYHRVHHSIEARHWNKNFALFFPVIDMIFGTAYFPKRGEFPATGVSSQPEPSSLKSYILAPIFPPRR
jgi:sterol desaturase/sphingolipid hydroxylase (fatty acid hydroxylase superfamily)